MGGQEGSGPSRSLRMDPGAGGINDEYNLAEDTQKLKEEMFANDDEDDVEGDQSKFLKVYKEQEFKKSENEKELTSDQLKFKQGEDAAGEQK